MAQTDRQRYLRARLRDALVYWLYIPAAVIAGGKAVDLVRANAVTLATAMLAGLYPAWKAARL